MEDINSWELKFKPCHYSSRLLDRLFLLSETSGQLLDMQEIQKAIYYARECYGDQKRKSGESCYSHQLEVAYMFAEYVAQKQPRYYRTDLIITAILHGAIEDMALTFEAIQHIFSRAIANQVMELIEIERDDRKINGSELIEILIKEKK